jgi:hypothetical protein
MHISVYLRNRINYLLLLFVGSFVLPACQGQKSFLSSTDPSQTPIAKLALGATSDQKLFSYFFSQQVQSNKDRKLYCWYEGLSSKKYEKLEDLNWSVNAGILPVRRVTESPVQGPDYQSGLEQASTKDSHRRFKLHLGEWSQAVIGIFFALSAALKPEFGYMDSHTLTALTIGVGSLGTVGALEIFRNSKLIRQEYINEVQEFFKSGDEVFEFNKLQSEQFKAFLQAVPSAPNQPENTVKAEKQLPCPREPLRKKPGESQIITISSH